jgi:hypothetical protein
MLSIMNRCADYFRNFQNGRRCHGNGHLSWLLLLWQRKTYYIKQSFRNNYYITKVARNKYYEGTNSTWQILHLGRDCMVVGFLTTCTNAIYPHWHWNLIPLRRGVQHWLCFM